ncbi:MAG: M48 family metalloprotease [Oligoflexia bacterium]|nr:M48 family metalloprotease [Oligoflexia bacterium]
MNESKNELEKLEKTLIQINATSMGRRAFLQVAPLLLAACATTQQHRQREGDNTGQETELTIEDERKMTQEVLPEMQKDYPMFQNQDMQLYVRSLGSKIVRANGLEGHPYNYNFTVVGVNQVNAFALPAGTVFVTAPLIAMADSEAELAGVIGHEVGHIKARHTAERMEKAKKEQSKGLLLGAGGGLLGAVAGFGLGKLLCAKNDKKCLMKATGIGAAAGIGGGLLIQKYYFMANSREDEMEADRIGFRTSVASGYHKDHVGAFYSKLLKMEQQHKSSNVPLLSGLSDALSTHPPSVERVQQMNQMASHDPAKKNAIVSTKNFDRMKAIAQNWVNSQPKA